MRSVCGHYRYGAETWVTVPWVCVSVNRRGLVLPADRRIFRHPNVKVQRKQRRPSPVLPYVGGVATSYRWLSAAARDFDLGRGGFQHSVNYPIWCFYIVGREISTLGGGFQHSGTCNYPVQTRTRPVVPTVARGGPWWPMVARWYQKVPQGARGGLASMGHHGPPRATSSARHRFWSTAAQNSVFST